MIRQAICCVLILRSLDEFIYSLNVFDDISSTCDSICLAGIQGKRQMALTLARTFPTFSHFLSVRDNQTMGICHVSVISPLSSVKFSVDCHII